MRHYLLPIPPAFPLSELPFFIAIISILTAEMATFFNFISTAIRLIKSATP